MTPSEFLKKWKQVELKERSASQSHFNDLCRLLDIDEPITADPKGEWFAFEKGATKSTGGEGWADVWRKGCFAWEYKGKKKNLDKAFLQLQQYAIALENPPLLIVSDMDRIRIHTNWTNTVQEIHEIALDDLMDGSQRDKLLHAFTAPERFKPSRTRQMVTEDAAKEFSKIAQRLRQRGHDGHEVAHFVNRLVFCMFAEDVGLLPDHMFTAMLKASRQEPSEFSINASHLFKAMANKGGRVGFKPINWFNGGLFDDDSALPLEGEDIENLIAAAKLDWSEIDPSILGTLFERGLDPSKRSQLGAHYTDRAKIMQIVKPVIETPLAKEWDTARSQIEKLVTNLPEESTERRLSSSERAKRTRAFTSAQTVLRQYIERLKNYRVLDPACGSGNFLYLALLTLKDLEHKANLEAEALGCSREFPSVGPECVLGIELNSYAAELARVSIWVGEIQWMRRNGFEASKNPILRSLGNIECRDAVLNSATGERAAWPKADVVVGNPPFLGDKKMLSGLGRDYTLKLRAAYKGQLAGRSDLVCYWFAQALTAINSGHLTKAGLVATNSIRQKSNRGILDSITASSEIFAAWSDEPWVVEGASVRVSIICFGDASGEAPMLDDEKVVEIRSDLTGATEGHSRLASAEGLIENSGTAFQGIKRVGKFEVSRDQALEWMKLPANPNGKKNSEVLRPWASGFDIVRRPQNMWIVDFGWDTPEGEAALYEAPFEYLKRVVKPTRTGKREARANEMWWIYYWPRPEMRKKLSNQKRFLARPSVSKYHVFRWVDARVLPDGALVVITREDDTTFGILQSNIHKVWALSRGSTLEDRPAYTPSTTFETFPFPNGLTPDIKADDYASDPRAIAIAEAAQKLDKLREQWLNPSDLVLRCPEEIDGFPKRMVPKDESAERALKDRTMAKLYNADPSWLSLAHQELDEAVAEAYGWGDDYRAGELTDESILSRLFELNAQRAATT